MNFYIQKTDTDRRAKPFKPNQIIHIKMKSPHDDIYGMGAIEKCVHSVVTSISTEALPEEDDPHSHPPTFAVAHDLNSSPGNPKTWRQKYASRNLGYENISARIEFEGKVEVHQFYQNKLEEYGLVKEQYKKRRSSVSSGRPRPSWPSSSRATSAAGEERPAGSRASRSTHAGRTKSWCSKPSPSPSWSKGSAYPTRALLVRGTGLSETTRSSRRSATARRIDRGIWSIDRAHDDVGEPPTTGSKDPIIVLSRDVVRVKDVEAKAERLPGAGRSWYRTPGCPTPRPEPDDDDEGDGTSGWHQQDARRVRKEDHAEPNGSPI